MFQPTIDAVVRGDPEAILFVEFAEDDSQRELPPPVAAQRGDRRSRASAGTSAGAKWGGVIEVLDPRLQSAINEMRTAGLNIMMSMKEEGKPVSFVEDCAVPLEHLAEYTSKLTDIFAKHGTRGTWYAHASVGCLHVRPVLNLRLDKDVKAHARDRRGGVRDGAAIQGLAFRRARRRHRALGIPRDDVRLAAGARLRGGEGPLRPQGPVQSRQDRARAEVRRPQPVSATAPTIAARISRTHLDWSAYPGAGGGFQGAVEMCNNNGACRALAGGVMCPSYRVTRDERDVTRGRANTLRLAITGQLGPDALASDAMAETLKLCVSCKACRRECPTGVDMARMKIEVQAARARQARPLAARSAGRLSSALRAVSRPGCPRLANLRNEQPTLAQMGREIRRAEHAAQPAALARRPVPRTGAASSALRERQDAPQVALFADTFNRYFEPENITAALAVLAAAGCGVHFPNAGGRPLCCGRTFLAVGLVEEARREAERCVAALAPFAARGIAGRRARAELRARLPRRDPGAAQERRRRGCSPQHVLLFEEYIARRRPRSICRSSRLRKRALLHGHCHQKSFGAMAAVEAALRLVPDLTVETVESSCCGMAGAFGYDADTIDVSLAMGELSLLPGRAQGRCRHPGGRRRHLLPPSDQGRHRPRGAPCRARAGDEPGESNRIRVSSCRHQWAFWPASSLTAHCDRIR